MTDALAAAEAELEAALSEVKSVASEPQNQANAEKNTPPPGGGSDVPEVGQDSAPKARPKGYDYLDLNEIPDDYAEFRVKVKDKIDYLYKQRVEADKKVDALKEHNRRLEEGVDYLLREHSVGKQKQDDQEIAQAKSYLKAEIKAARDYGDLDRESELIDQLSQINAAILFRDQQAKMAPEQNRPPQQKASVSQDDYTYTADEMAYARMLMQEEDEEGNPLRPWMQQNHPDFRKALANAEAITKGLRERGKEARITNIMPQLDKMMRGGAQASHAPVLGANPGFLTPPAKDNSMRLNETQKKVVSRIGVDLKTLGIDGEKQLMKVAALKRVRLEDVT